MTHKLRLFCFVSHWPIIWAMVLEARVAARTGAASEEIRRAS